jgi:uncharacterized membrane protein YjjP (DUF1212 family)
VLGVQSSFLYLPAILILAFRDDDARSSDVLLLRPAGALDLYRLSLVHKVYRLVVHDVISVNSGARALRRIIKEVGSCVAEPSLHRLTLRFRTHPRADRITGPS